MATKFQNDKCKDFNSLIAAARKDDVGKHDWIASVRDLSFETDFDAAVGAWTYDMVWHGAGPIKKASMTPFSFGQWCRENKCPPKFLLTLPGNIAKQSIDFFKQDAKERDLMLRVRDTKNDAGQPFTYVRGIVKPQSPLVQNVEVLEAMRDVVAEQGMRVWKAHLRDEDFHAKLIWGEDINIGTMQSPDNVNVGIHLANSEVGSRPLEMHVMVFRLVCTNGMISMIDGVPLLRKASFGMTREEIRAEIANATKKIGHHKDRIIGAFQDAQGIKVKSPLKTINALSKHFKLSAGEVVILTQEWNRGKATGEYRDRKIDIVNALTKSAQQFNAEDRMRFEVVAGQFLADKNIVEKVNEAAVAVS